MSQLESAWPYLLTGTTTDKHATRTTVRNGFSHELVGMDGELMAGVRPHSGFTNVYELDFECDSNVHDATSEVIDFFPVTLRIGTEDFTYGFVYRVKRSSLLGQQDLSDVFFDFYDRFCGRWRSCECIGQDVDPDVQMDVKVYGRLGYVFLEGRSPILFYIEDPFELEDPTLPPTDNDYQPVTMEVVGQGGSLHQNTSANFQVGVTPTRPLNKDEFLLVHVSYHATANGDANAFTIPENPTLDPGFGGRVALRNNLTNESVDLVELDNTQPNATVGNGATRKVTLVDGFNISNSVGGPCPDNPDGEEVIIPYRGVIVSRMYYLNPGENTAPSDWFVFADFVSEISMYAGCDDPPVDPNSFDHDVWMTLYACQRVDLTDPIIQHGSVEVSLQATGQTSDRVQIGWVQNQNDGTLACGLICDALDSFNDAVAASVPPGDIGVNTNGIGTVLQSDSELATDGGNTFRDRVMHYRIVPNPVNAGGHCLRFVGVEANSAFDQLVNVGWVVDDPATTNNEHVLSAVQLRALPPDEPPTTTVGPTTSVVEPDPCDVDVVVTVLGKQGSPPLPGPGLQPCFDEVIQEDCENAFPLGTLDGTGDPERPGYARMHITSLSPSNTGLFPIQPLPAVSFTTVDPEFTPFTGDPTDPLPCTPIPGTPTSSTTPGSITIPSTVTTPDIPCEEQALLCGSVVNNVPPSPPDLSNQDIDADILFECTVRWICSDVPDANILLEVSTNDGPDPGFTNGIVYTAGAMIVGGGPTIFDGVFQATMPGMTLTTAQTYYWRFKGLIPECAEFLGTFSEVLEFNGQNGGSTTTIPDTTIDCSADTAQDMLDNFNLSLLAPPNGTVITQQTSVRLQWNGSYTDGRDEDLPENQVLYDVLLDTISPPQQVIVQNLTQEFFDVQALDPQQQYYWDVRVRRLDCDDWPGSTSANGPWNFRFEGAGVDSRLFIPGDYAFGYFLYDSRTGRKSSFSEVSPAQPWQFPCDAEGELTECCADPLDNTDPRAYLESRQLGFFAMELVWDSVKYDQAYIFRSVRTQSVGGVYTAGILQLDAIIDLEDYQTINNGAGTLFPPTQPFRQSLYYYVLEDKQLVWQTTFTEQVLFDERMPYAGTAEFNGQVLLTSKIKSRNKSASGAEQNRPNDALTGIGEMRWSSLMDESPELFPPFNRWTPNLPSAEAIALKRVGPNVVGFCRDRLYHCRWEGPYMEVQEFAQGFGIVNHRAVATAQNQLYYISDKGLKTVGPYGEFNELDVMNGLLLEDWEGDLGQVSCAFDAQASVLWMLNPVKDRAAQLWFNTNMLTETVDMPFDLCAAGAWPEDPLEYDNSVLVERAFFLQNSPKDVDFELIPDWKPRIYVFDWKREKQMDGALTVMDQTKPRLTTLDIEGDTRFVVESWDQPTGELDLVIDAGAGPDLISGFEGAEVYILRATDVKKIGQHATIKRDADSGDPAVKRLVIKSEDRGSDFEPSAGDRVGISPVPVRWVGQNVTMRSENGEFGGTDFHRVKHIDGMGCTFADVSGPAIDDGEMDNVWIGLVYKGNEETPSYSARPVDPNTGGADAGLEAGESIQWCAFGPDPSEDIALQLEGRFGVDAVSLSPGFTTFIPDVDYRLLSALVNGKIRKTERSSQESPNAQS